MNYKFTPGMIIGLILFLVGLIGISAYSFWLGMTEITDPILLGFFGAIGLGFIILMIAVLLDQQRGKKENFKNIRKEDLRP